MERRESDQPEISKEARMQMEQQEEEYDAFKEPPEPADYLRRCADTQGLDMALCIMLCALCLL